MMTITGYEHRCKTIQGYPALLSDVWAQDEAGIKRRFSVTSVSRTDDIMGLIEFAETYLQEGIERVNKAMKERKNA